MDAVRTCLGCRQRSERTSLVRVVVVNGEVVVDHSATLPGRGAWVHPVTKCGDTALSRKAFGRALRNAAARIDADALRQEFTHHPFGTTTEGPPENRLNGPVNN